MSNLHSDPDGVIGGAKRADKVGNLESVRSGVIGIAKHIDEVDNLESDPGGVGGGAKRAHEVGNLIRSQSVTSGQKKKILLKRPYLWNRQTYIPSTPLKSKLLACST